MQHYSAHRSVADLSVSEANTYTSIWKVFEKITDQSTIALRALKVSTKRDISDWPEYGEALVYLRKVPDLEVRDLSAKRFLKPTS